ncbi:hypothetical protein [Paenibacillus sp. LHD-38]|uniref:hypothetical protein n=1 Tax=Paenibacillus sp. LHD-38 TaxID=3072143 RepID=UPI00280CB2CD|nr:hypothetical protein [Paenibacillus sp. LHD-38]MDQ8736645.1 hypothetical protein [Paenibacillus sp. LHD-38]
MKNQGFGALKEHFNVLTNSVDPNNFILWQCAIGTQNGKPFFLIRPMAHEYHRDWNARGQFSTNGTQNTIVLSLNRDGFIVKFLQV